MKELALEIPILNRESLFLKIVRRKEPEKKGLGLSECTGHLSGTSFHLRGPT